jgi:formate--tetrahydrofolate ligase
MGMIGISEVLSKYGIYDYEQYGKYMAKIPNYDNFGNGKVVLVTATNPTKYGEGKTTVAIGLNDALNALNHLSIVNLREPSMGPVFGIKGGDTGGGKAKVIPEDKINLHFTGDMHAITSANNLISAVIDNEIIHNNKLDITTVTFNRCIDMNDRALRNIKLNNREEHFDITASSEIMSVLCLSKDYEDLRRRLDNIIIGYNSHLVPIHLSSLDITDAILAILNDAIKPNAVQTLEGNLAIIHGGPFANTSNGCSSIMSLKTSTNLSEYVVTEAGFGADAGAYKFMDILTRNNKFNLSCIVLVTTIRSLKNHGNGSLEHGIENLYAHIQNLKLMSDNIIVTLNKFDEDEKVDIDFISNYVKDLGCLFNINTVYKNGSAGAIELANQVLSFKEKTKVRYLYNLDDNLYTKIDSYVKNICHANSFDCSFDLMNKINKLNIYKYPICIAKTQYSLSDNPKLLGNPDNYKMTLKDIKVLNGAELIVCYFGNIITMPGLSEYPSAKEIKIDNGNIIFPK